jgi:hypothetical protein
MAARDGFTLTVSTSPTHFLPRQSLSPIHRVRNSRLLRFPLPSSIMIEMNAICPCCAAKFPCDPSEHCWCAKFPRTGMPTTPTACLCPDCLSRGVEKMLMEEGENRLQKSDD